MKFTSGTIWKQLIRYFVPLLFGALLQQFYNTADAVIVGKYIGKEALSAVGGSAAVLFGIIIGFFTGISSGSTVVVGRYFGAEREEEVAGAIQTSLWLSVLGGVLIGTAGYFLTPWMLELLHTPKEIMPEAVSYMRIFFCGTVGNLFFNMGVSIIRALGDSKTPMLLGVVGSSVNVCLNLLFILAFHSGVEGVAFATIISQLLCAVFVLWALKKKKCFRMKNQKRQTLHKKYLKQILQAGLPMGIQTIMHGLSNGVMQANINLFGTDTVAAWTAYSKIAAFYWTVMAAMGITVTAFVSQNYGAHKMERVKAGVREGLLISIGLTLAMSLVFQVWSMELIGIFTEDIQVLHIGVQQLELLSALYILYVGGEIFVGALRGIGHSFGTMVSSLITVCGLSVVWVESIGKHFDNMLVTLLGFPVTWIASSIVLMLYWKKLLKRKIV